MKSISIRKIQPDDNAPIANVIRAVFEQEGYPRTGTAYADPQLDYLFESYQAPKSVYFVIESEGRILGGGGIAPLDEGALETCELQKMYFLPEVRGKGVGQQMIQQCLEAAAQRGFQYCYLETLPQMKAAQHVYQKMGFTYLDAPMGSTGHISCPVWMIKSL
ncbi:GNAT family N-acetyltransferase [Flavobacterium sp.]|uniref:GNAT family N-acetyltransferase n=1 Tax=Flavobacterium sp. TaxID=239 RepID=UPI002627CD3A|nr:GNAT family N-acetyltransferase [Flavobacterium sp.]